MWMGCAPVPQDITCPQAMRSVSGKEVCGGLWRVVAVCDWLWWFVVGCGGFCRLWWFVVGCGGFYFCRGLWRFWGFLGWFVEWFVRWFVKWFVRWFVEKIVEWLS